MATAVAADTFAETAAQTKRENNDEKSIPEEVEIVLEKLLTEENKKVEIINNPHEEADEEPSKVLDKDDDDGGILKGESEGKTSSYSEDTNDGTTLQDKKSDTNEKTLSEEVERGLDKLLATEENNPQEGCDGTVEGEKMAELSSTHKAITEENYSSAEYIGKPCSKTEKEIQENLFSEGKDSEGKDFGIVLNNKGIPPYVSQGESEEKTSHSEDTNEGTTLKERVHEETGTLTDIVGGTSENRRENDEMQPVEPEAVLDKQAPQETNTDDTDNPREFLKNNEDGNDGTVEVEKAVELLSVAKAIEEPNSSPEPIENPINTEDEMLPIEPGVVLDKQAPEETNTVEIDNPHESLKNNEDGNDRTIEVEKAVELPSVAKAIEEPNSSAEPIEKPINTEDEILSVQPEVVLDKQALEETNKVEIDNPCESLNNNEDGNGGTVEVEKVVDSVAKAIEEPNSSVEPIEKAINTEDEMLPVEPEVVLDKQAPEETNTVEIDNPRESLKNNEDGKDGTVEVEKVVDLEETNLDEAVLVIPKPLADSAQVSETVLQVDINTNDNDDNHPSKILEKDMVDGSLPQENPKEKLSDMITEHEKPASMEAPRGLPTDDNVTATVCEGISEVKQQCTAEMSKDDADSKNTTCENNAEISLYVVHEEIERSGLQQNTELTFRKELILDKIDDVILKGESGDEFSHSENINDGIALYEKQLHEEMDNIADIEEGTSETHLHEEMGTLTDIVGGISENQRENDEMQPLEPEVVLDKQAQEETNIVEIDNPCESLKTNEDGNGGTVEVEKAVELPSVAKVIEEPNSSAEPIENPINTEDEVLPVEHKVVLDIQDPKENDRVEIDNPRESLKNEDGNDGTAEVEKAVELPSVAKAIEKPNSSAEPIEKPINTEDEILPGQPEVVLDKQAPKETNKVEIDNPRESLKNNEDGNDGTVEVEKAVELPSVPNAIEDPNNTAEPIENPFNTEDEILSIQPEVVLDKQAPEETNMVEIDNSFESLKNNEDGNDGTVEVETVVDSVAKAIEEPNSSVEPIEKPINAEDEMLPVEPEVVLDKQASEETDTVEIVNPHESMKNNDGNDGTVAVEMAVELPSAAKAIEEPNSSVETIEKSINTEDEMQPVEPEVVLDKPAPEETNMVEIDNPRESLKNNDGNDGTVEVEKAVELPSAAKAIEEPNSSLEPIEKPINTEDEMLPVEPELVLDKQAPEETNTVEIDNLHESLKNNEDGNDGIVEVEKAVESHLVKKVIEEPNSSPGESEDKFCHSENINDGIALHEKLHEEMATITDLEEGTSETKRENDEMQPVEPGVLLDKQAQEETNIVEIDNPCESLKNNEDGNDGTAEVEMAVELPSVAKAIEEPNSSPKPIENPTNTEDEILPVQPEVVLDKQAPEETNKVEIDNPCESLKNNEDGNDGTVEVEKVVDSVAKAIEEPNSSEEPIEKEINTEDEKQQVETEIMLDKQAQEETNTVEIDNPRESLKHNEDCNDGTVVVEKADELPSVAKAIEEHNSSVEPIEKPINTEDEMQPVEPEVLLDKQAPEETNTVEIDIPHEYLKNNEDGNNGTVQVEEAVELPSAAKIIEEPKSSPEPIENSINTEDEMLPVEPEIVLDQQAPEETNTVEIDNPCESLKNNDGTVEVEKAVELPSAAKAIEEPNSSAEPIENTINTDDEILPVQPEVVLDKQAPEETNMVEIDNPCESLKNNDNVNDGTVEVEKAIEEPNSSVEPIEKPINTEDEMLPIEPKVVLDKQALEEKNTVEIDNPREFLEKNEDNNDGTVKVEKDVDSPSAAKAIEEPNNSPGESKDKFSHSENINDGIALHENQLHEEMATIANIAEGTSETKRESDDKTLPVEAEVVFNKLVPEEKTVEFDNPHEFLKRDEGSNETVGCENVIELPSISKAIVEEHNGSQEPIGKPSKTGDEMPEKLLSKGENSDGQDMGIILNRGIPLNETQQEAEEVSNELDKDDDKGKAPEEISVQADLTENLKDSEESGEACKEQGKPFIPEGKNMDSMVVESSDDKEDERVEKEECFPQITCNDMETESAHGVDDLLSSQLVASEIKKTTLDEASPPSEVFTADLQGEINTSDNDYSNQSKILEQDTTVDGNLSTACKAQENPEKTLSDLITKHEGNLPKESEGPVSTEASRGLHTDENETTAVCEVTSQMKQHGTAETVKDDADSKNSICQNGAEKNLNATQEEIEGSCLQQNTEPTTFSKELISEQNNEGILEGEGEDKASHSQITDEGITLQEKQLHEEVATIADIAEGTSETKKENDEKTLPDEHEVMLDKLAPDESKKVEIGNPPEISKSSEEGSDGTVECEKMIELPSVAKDTIEENNRSTEPTDNPSNTEDELSGKLFSEGENRESQPEAEEPSKALETDDDEGMPPEKTFVQADAVINCPADFTEYLKEDSEKSGEVYNENDNTQCILATKTSFPNDDSNETNAQGIADKEQDKDFIPEGENMDSLVVESHDDKEDGKVKKEESLAETCKIPLMEIQSQSSDSQDAHNVIGSPLSTSPIEETSSEKVGSSEVEPESTKASSDTMEDEFVKHDEVETETIQGVNDLLGSQLVSPEIEETGSGEGTSVSETIADPAPLIEVHGTVLKDGVHMDENKEDHQCKIIEKDNIVDDSVTVQEENITRAGEEQASEEELRGLHRDENETVVVHDVISEVEQQDTIELSKDDVDSEDSLFKYESEKENLHAPCEETEKAALPQNADQTASNEELISVKDDEVLRGESEDKAAHSDNNGETNPQETNMLTVDLDEAKSIQGNENSEWANDSTVDEKPEQQIYTATDMPTQELKYAYETNKIPEIEVLGDTSAQGQSDLDLISACPADIHVAEDTGENSNEMCLEEVADMKNQEDQIKQNGSQRAASEVRGNLSKGIENEISKDCVCSNTIIDKEESLNSRIPRGNEEEAKESKEEIKEPVKEANYHNFQTTHADTEEQVICVLTNAQNTMQSEEKMLPKEKECHVQNFSLLKTSEENEDQISETAEPLMAATREMETELVEVQGKIAPVSSGLTSEKDVVTGNEIEVDTDETDTVPNQENDSSLNRKVNIETVAAGEDTDTREMSLHEEQIEACLSITDDKVASSLEEENPITKIVNETTIAETSSPLGTREGMVTKDILLEEEQHSVINSEGRSEKSDHIIESASEVHKLEMPLEAEKIGFVEENLAETETEEIVIKETNEENDIIKADISSEQTQIADQSVIVKSSLDYPEEVLSLDAYREVELKPEENELERLGENESIKEEASSDNKAEAEENAIKSLTQEHGETAMEMGKDGETEVQQKNLDFSFNIKDSAVENSSTETEQKDVKDNIDIIESAQEHVPGHPYKLQNDEADPAKIQNDNSTDSEEKGSKNEATEAASNEAAGLECGEDAKTEVEVNKETDRSQTMESSTLSDSNLVLGSIDESSQVTEHEDTKSQTEKLCDFTHKDSEMTQPRDFPSDFTEIKNYIDDKLAQHESKVAVLDTEFPAEAYPHENTEVRTSSEGNDSQEMQQNSKAATTHNDLEEMKPENAGETKDNFEGLVFQEEKRTVDHSREKLGDTSLTQSTILQESIEQILKPKQSEDNEAENEEQIKSMQEEDETKNMETAYPNDIVQSMQEKETNNNINASQLPKEETKERRTATEAGDEASSMAGLPGASLNEREVILYKEEDEASKVETEQHEEEEEEGGEHKGEDSGPEAPVIVENDAAAAAGDADVKAGKKKHHNILSGVGSKVKHSIAKVKKVITGKSSPTKQQSPK